MCFNGNKTSVVPTSQREDKKKNIFRILIGFYDNKLKEVNKETLVI